MTGSPRESTLLFPSLSLALFLTPLIAGCSTFQQMFPTVGMSSATVEEPPQPPAGATVQLEMLAELSIASAEQQAVLLRDIHEQYLLAPNAINRLHLALALATPTHEGQDLSQGADMLDELLAEDTLRPAERLLAISTRASARAWLAERDASLAASRAERQAALAAVSDAQLDQRRRTESLSAEIRRLEQALAEAEQKLEALMSIERTIRERD